jgi:transposase
MADKGYGTNALRTLVGENGMLPNIPLSGHRKDPIYFSGTSTGRNLIERFFNKIKQFRSITTRYDKLAENFLASLKLACILIWLRGNDSTAW